MIKEILRYSANLAIHRAEAAGYIKRAAKLPRPDAWDDTWYENQGHESLTGLQINEESAMRFATFWACVKVISEDLASLPLFTFRRKDLGRMKADDLRIYYLLHDSPNPEMSAMQFRETMQSHLLRWGSCYAQIDRNLMGEIRYLWPLNPSRMEVTRPNKQLVYEYTPTGESTPTYYPRNEVFHIGGLGFNGLTGYSVVGFHRDAVGTGLAGQQYQATAYRDGNRMQVAFVHPAPKAPDEDMRKEWRDHIRKEYAGVGGQKIGLFWEGMKPENIGMTNEDAQYIEGRKFSRSEICAIFRVPPHMVMDLERATFDNIEHQSIEYVIRSLRPWAVRWEQAINQQLLKGSYTYYAEHSLDALLRGDIKSRYDAYAVGRQWGWLSRNDIRESENMNPIEGGDDYLTPMNMNVLGEESNEDPPTDDELLRAAKVIRKLRLIKGKQNAS